MFSSSLDLSIIGNSAISALIDQSGQIVWCCFPRFDGDPIFCSLVDDSESSPTGHYSIELLNCVNFQQKYKKNTAIVSTILTDKNGGSIEISDFIPRFKQYGRIFRPMTIVRIVKRLNGSPRICIKLRPKTGYGAYLPQTTIGSNHIRFFMKDLNLRLTTDAPISFIEKEIPFVLENTVTLLFGPDEPLEENVTKTGRDFYEHTSQYWFDWSRSLSIPFEWQDPVIRAAITLQLSSFEDSGAIIAAHTTSIPEAQGSKRNWDYRFCWLRDSFFVVQALNSLGATHTMENYLCFINNIVAGGFQDHIQPVFGISMERILTEIEIPSLSGYHKMGPVRAGNSAYQQIQNDGYGSLIMACAQMFFDERLAKPGGKTLFKQLEIFGEKAATLWDKPDAGIWELRTRSEVHTFSSLMCWVACDRLQKISRQMQYPNRETYWLKKSEKIKNGIITNAWNKNLNSFCDTFGGTGADACLLLMADLGFLSPKDPKFLGTLNYIEKKLRVGPFLFRYQHPDDYGVPETSFNVCTFWFIDALAMTGRKEEARNLFENMLKNRNSVGLLAEDIDPQSGQHWGNFPQTYSMVGLIKSAIRLSCDWNTAF